MSRKRNIPTQGQKEEGAVCSKGCGGADLQFFYFIGRMNPPTTGHIELLSRLIYSAKENNTKAIIVIGGGPQGGVLSLDNPVKNDLKIAIIESWLTARGFQPNEYIISDNSNFAGSIYDNIYKQIVEKEESGVQINSVRITQVAGNKGNDLDKLSWVQQGLVERLSKNYSSCRGDVLPIEAIPIQGGIPMSATSVRKDTYRFYLDSDKDFTKALQLFTQKYGQTYGSFTDEVFRQIMNPLINNTPRAIQMPVSDEILRQYINGVKDDEGTTTDLHTKFYVCPIKKQTKGGRRKRTRRTRRVKKTRKTRWIRRTKKIRNRRNRGKTNKNK